MSALLLLVCLVSFLFTKDIQVLFCAAIFAVAAELASIGTAIERASGLINED